MPGAMILFEYNFLKVFLVTVSGGIFGNIFFTFLSAAILKWWHQRRVKKGNLHKQKIFTKTNKRIILIKKRFGLTGIALLTPILFSIPLGAFIAEKFYKDKRKIIIYLSVSVVFWNLVIYLLINFFHNTYAKWLI
jgi:hypothetical protein